MTNLVLLVQAASTLCMVGVIWVIQLVHYPLFAMVAPDRFPEYERSHCDRITWVVGPLMLAEMATTVLLPWLLHSASERRLAWVGFALLVLIWVVTYTVQVPQHARLSASFDLDLQQKLVQGNWIRTVCWSLRGLVALAILSKKI